MIRLMEVNQGNWEKCIQLKPKREQKTFIASNLYSIAESKFLPDFMIRAIYDDEIVVGFAMYGKDPDDGNYWIYRLMIDERFQGCGYGKEALLLIIQDIKSMPDRTDVILLGCNPDNDGARVFFSKAGFKEVGLAPWGEMLAKYNF